MKLPALFLELNQSSIQQAYVNQGYVSGVVAGIVLLEPLGGVSDTPPEGSGKLVYVRVINERGVLRAEAETPADLQAIEAWAERHRDATAADFRWRPS